MIEVKSTLTEQKLIPIVTETRPLISRIIEAGIFAFILLVLFYMASAFYLLAETAFGFAETYKNTEPSIRNEVINQLMEDKTFSWKIAFVLIIGLPVFCYLTFLAARTAHGIFDDRYLARRLFKNIAKTKGCEITYRFSENGIEVINEKGAPEEFTWPELKKAQWLGQSLIFKFEKRAGHFIALIDDIQTPNKLDDLKTLLTLVH